MFLIQGQITEYFGSELFQEFVTKMAATLKIQYVNGRVPKNFVAFCAFLVSF